MLAQNLHIHTGNMKVTMRVPNPPKPVSLQDSLKKGAFIIEYRAILICQKQN